MIGRKDHDGVLVHAVVAQRVEQELNLAVAVSYGVEVIITQHPPPTIFVRPPPDLQVQNLLVDLLGDGTAGAVERLVPAGLQRRIVPGRAVELVVGRPRDRHRMAGTLDVLRRQIGVEVHHVMRIDEVHREIPGLALGAERLRLGPQPGDRRGKRRVVVAVATERAVDQVADAEEVLEAIGGNGVAVCPQRRIDGLGREIEIGGQVPLALVGGMVPELTKTVADGLDAGRQVALPDVVQVVGDARLLDVLAGVDDRPRRGTGCCSPVASRPPGAPKPAFRRAGHWPTCRQ